VILRSIFGNYHLKEMSYKLIGGRKQEARGRRQEVECNTVLFSGIGVELLLHPVVLDNELVMPVWYERGGEMNRGKRTVGYSQG
jgi:hypothetical protein